MTKKRPIVSVLKDQVVVDSEGNRSVVDVVLTQPRFTATMTMPSRICHACHNPVSAEVCAACGNKQP